MKTKSISVKKIRDKEYYYIQYRDGNKIVSKSISLKEALSQAFANSHTDSEEILNHKFNTSVHISFDLYSLISSTQKFNKRFIYADLADFMTNDEYGKVFILYGIRRTGKTTMMYQSLLDLPINQFADAAYIRIQENDTFEKLDKDLNYLTKHGFKYIMIDEITLLDDFISSSSILSDIYGFKAKIVLSGTDSLEFLFSSYDELYNRGKFLHTTFISYKEFDAVLGNKTIDDYIEFGGTLSKEAVDYNNKIRSGKYSYNEYTNTAIAKNIEHSLSVYQDGSHFASLKKLHQQGELTNIINRLIEDVNHEFAITTIEKDFKSHDYGSLKELLRKEKNSDEVRYALDNVDENQVITLLMNALDIINKEKQKTKIDQQVIDQIEEYLLLLDVIGEIDVIDMTTNYVQKKKIFIEPGLRYSQAKELLDILLADKEVQQLPLMVKEIVQNKLLEDVKGRLLEEIVQYHVSRNKKAFKALFSVGEYDLVIIDENERCIDLFEIKHATTINPRQYHFLNDKKANERIEYLYYPIRSRNVIYRGRNDKVDNIHYINVEEFLKGN